MWQRYEIPNTVDEALQILARYEGRAQLIAGGTDLVLELQQGKHQVDCLVDVTRIPGLAEIEQQEGWILLGANVTFRQIKESALLRDQARVLAEAAASVGALQIQTVATLAGNLVSALPAADGSVALVALDAEVQVTNPAGPTWRPVAELFLAPGQSAVDPRREMITAIRFPAALPHQGSAWERIGRRRALVLPILNCAVNLALDASGQRISGPGSAWGRSPRCPFAPAAPSRSWPAPRRRRRSLPGPAPWPPRNPTHAPASCAPRASIASRCCPCSSAAGWPAPPSKPAPARRPAPERRPAPLRRPPEAPPTLARRSVSDMQPDLYTLNMTVNGRPVSIQVEADELLVDALRERLGLTGTKIGCNEGECGACTVLLDDQPVLSCLLPALRAQGRDVLTVEGLRQGDQLHPLQEAFIDHGAVQCGYCTPGFLLSAKALLDRNPQPSRDEIKEAIAGNLCRCTGYVKIVEAIEAVAASR
jgi:xanthine dehydrogenase iron-sulfur cluster and FAD-binding subunit A